MTHKGQGTLVVDTGVGKCKIAIDYIKQSPDIFTVLITSPRENLKKNWAEEIEKWKAESAIDIVADIDSRSNDLLADVYVVLENIQACYKWENKHLF
jgi:superfamily II DNA or RNA helicase